VVEKEEFITVLFFFFKCNVPSRFVAKTTACGTLPSCTAAARVCSREVVVDIVFVFFFVSVKSRMW
jgi:hypothetical protein